MGIDYNRLQTRISANLATGIRGDFDVADFQRLDEVTAHILLEFSPVMGRPRGDDIERYFAKTFESKIVPVMSSVSIKSNCVSVIAQVNVATRPIEDSEDKSKMTPVVAGMMYLDNSLQDVWEVKDGDGQKVLAKSTKENIEQIIATRRNRMFVTKSSSLSLSSLATAKEMLTAGCVVKVWHQGKLMPMEITAAIKGGFKGKVEGDHEIVVAKENVLDLQKMADEGPNESAMLVKYFTDAYGDKNYAKLLIKK